MDMQQGPKAAAVRPGGPRDDDADTPPYGGEQDGWRVARDAARDGRTAADIYLEVQRSAAFQEVRGRYRGFVVPASAAFLGWYLAYVLAATLAPGVMARPVAGAVNVAMVAGLAQFLTTFVLTWAYVRNARRGRDRAALELRWTVLDRGAGGAGSSTGAGSGRGAS
ncbi:hypothetical protein GCM10023082_03160 [Streptomyces tremellae]|uniref:DUF485 domain-containing protein n=1 Tax=Streptomyces tremellae TaxID=1124239 RepID=A0ABP7DPH5_9ACTN